MNTQFKGQGLQESVVHRRLCEFVDMLLPSAIKLRQFNGQFVYQVPMEDFDAEGLFNMIESRRKELKIVDWGIS